MRAIFRTPQFFILAGVFFLCCAAYSGPIFHNVSYAMLCGASALAAASIYSVEGFAGLFGRVFFGVLADRIGVKRVIVGGLALQAIGIYCYIYISELQHFYMLALLLGLVYGGVMPLYSVLARDYFGPKVMGTVHTLRRGADRSSQQRPIRRRAGRSRFDMDIQKPGRIIPGGRSQPSAR